MTVDQYAKVLTLLDAWEHDLLKRPLLPWREAATGQA